MFRRIRMAFLSAFTVFALGLVNACAPPAIPKKGGDHDHPDHGPHGGPFADWNEYHVEFTVDHEAKQVTLYVLDEKIEKSPINLDPKKITKLSVTITSPEPTFKVDVTYDAKKSEEKKGFAFVGKNDRFADKVEFKGSIDGTIDGTPYTDKFPNEGYKKP